MAMRSSGGGVFVMIGLLAGAVIGVRHGEGTAGMLIGLGVGLLLALLVAVVGSRRSAKRERGLNGPA